MKTVALLFILFLSLRISASAMPADSISIHIALAEEHKSNMEYHKALGVYRELCKTNPAKVEYLTACAEIEVLMGNEETAMQTYSEVLRLDPDNLTANIYMGNYYFLVAEMRRKKIDEEYQSSTSPARARNLHYKKQLNLIYITDYSTSKKYLENVIRSFPSVEAKRTLEKIEKIGKFVGDK